MGAFETFPYTNFQDLNLNWIIQQIKNITKEWYENKQVILDLEKDFYELKEYVISTLDGANFEQLVSDKLDEMLESGELEQLIIEALDDIVTLPSIINLNRLGSEFRNYEALTYPLMQGFTMTDKNTMYVYYSKDDGSYGDNGLLRKVNPKDNITIEEAVVDGGHGQSLTNDGEYIYIVNYINNQELINQQYITKVDMNNLSNNIRKIVNLPIPFTLFGLSYYNGKLYGVGSSASDYTKAIKVELVESETGFTATDYVYLDRFDTPVPLIDMNISNGLIYLLTNSNNILVYYINGVKKGVIHLPLTYTDGFMLQEPEGFHVFNDGTLFINHIVTISKTANYVRSGSYVTAWGYGNVLIDIANRYFNEDSGQMMETYRIYVSNVSGTFSGTGALRSSAVDSLYTALCFKKLDKNINQIIIMDDDTENINKLVIRQYADLEIRNESTSNTFGYIYLVDVNNVELNKFKITDTLDIRNGKMVTLENNTINKIYVSGSFIMDCDTVAKNEYNIDNYSIYYNPNTRPSREKFINNLPYTTRAFVEVQNPTVASDGYIHTGWFLRSGVQRNNILQLFVTFNDGTTTRYARILIAMYSTDWYVDLVNGGQTRKARLRIADNELCIQSIEGLQLTSISNVIVYTMN